MREAARKATVEQKKFEERMARLLQQAYESVCKATTGSSIVEGQSVSTPGERFQRNRVNWEATPKKAFRDVWVFGLNNNDNKRKVASTEEQEQPRSAKKPKTNMSQIPSFSEQWATMKKLRRTKTPTKRMIEQNKFDERRTMAKGLACLGPLPKGSHRGIFRFSTKEEAFATCRKFFFVTLSEEDRHEVGSLAQPAMQRGVKDAANNAFSCFDKVDGEGREGNWMSERHELNGDPPQPVQARLKRKAEDVEDAPPAKYSRLEGGNGGCDQRSVDGSMLQVRTRRPLDCRPCSLHSDLRSRSERSCHLCRQRWNRSLMPYPTQTVSYKGPVLDTFNDLTYFNQLHYAVEKRVWVGATRIESWTGRTFFMNSVWAPAARINDDGEAEDIHEGIQ